MMMFAVSRRTPKGRELERRKLAPNGLDDQVISAKVLRNYFSAPNRIFWRPNQLWLSFKIELKMRAHKSEFFFRERDRALGPRCVDNLHKQAPRHIQRARANVLCFNDARRKARSSHFTWAKACQPN